MHCFAVWPSSLSGSSIAARSMSPVEMCTDPNASTSFSATVPLPDAGAPQSTALTGGGFTAQSSRLYSASVVWSPASTTPPTHTDGGGASSVSSSGSGCAGGRGERRG